MKNVMINIYEKKNKVKKKKHILKYYGLDKRKVNWICCVIIIDIYDKWKIELWNETNLFNYFIWIYLINYVKLPKW